MPDNIQDADDDLGVAIDIRDETAAICQKLGLDPSNVADLAWSPRMISANVFLLNDRGAKYVDPETGDAAMKHFTRKIIA